jgi:High potential iron-sulfur protein
MNAPLNGQRRALLRRLGLGLTLAPMVALESRAALGADSLPLLSESDPAAKAEQYVADAKRASNAPPGALCSNCSIYAGANTGTQGTCTLFPGKLVKAAGWCKSWSGL